MVKMVRLVVRIQRKLWKEEKRGMKETIMMEDSSEQEEEVEDESEQVQVELIVEDEDTETDSLVPVLDDNDEAERKLLD